MPAPNLSEQAAVAEARARVLERIERAAARSGRAADTVTLVAVSKTVPAERLRAAVAAGLDTLGENRVQEAAGKAPDVPGARWHLVGPLQSNKARRAVGLFEVIETIGSLELARRVGSVALELGSSPARVLLQVNVDEDPAKAGFAPDALRAQLDDLGGVDGLRVEGLMTVGRMVGSPEDARPTFVALRRLSEELRPRWPALDAGLSMGMSDDFEVAIEEGATIVRVGRALFGERPHH